MTPGNSRSKRWTLVAAGAAVLVAAAAVGWAVSRGSDRTAGSGHAPDSRVKTALLARAKPNPHCPDAPAAPSIHDGQKLVSVMRVVDGCLAIRAQAVQAGKVGDRLAQLRSDPDVVAADVPPRRPVPAESSESTASGKQWALADLQADKVRALWPDNADVRVAIIDTAIDDSNPDLAGQVVEKAPWVHLYKGKADDHGTHVAGIVAAKDDGRGVLGLTPKAKLLDAQYWDTTRNNSTSGPFADTAEVIRWAVDHGADVLNMSFSGSELSDTEEAALRYAERAGAVSVSIAGNCGSRLDGWFGDCEGHNEVRYPGAFDPTVLSVANYDRKHHRDPASTANGSVDVAAPGHGIVSTCRMPDHPSCSKDGTSMAAPFVAATAALLRARHPDATPAAIREAIVGSTRAAPGHQAGVHSDEYGTGLLDPVAAASYLDSHPGPTPRPSGSGGGITPDTVVAGYLTADHQATLATAGGTKIPVAGLGGGPSAPRLAFSRDGQWFAAADGATLAIVNVPSLRQDKVSCTCTGVAFTDQGQLLTADQGVIATYEPATASKLHGVRVRNTSGTGLPTFSSMTVEGAAGDVAVVGAQFASAGYGVFGVRSDGRTFLIGRGPDPGVGKIVVSDDRRWVAWSIRGVCGQRSQMGVADLQHPGSTATFFGPLDDGAALQLRFDGDTVIAGWAPMQRDGGQCREPAWPPKPAQTDRPAIGTGSTYQPATVRWKTGDDQRIVVGRWPSGESAVLQPTDTAGQYELSFGSGPGGGSTITLDGHIIDVATAPSGSSGRTTPSDGPTSAPSTATRSPAPHSPAPHSSAPHSPAPSKHSGSAPTVQAAISRYEAFLHAVGSSDTDTVCDIAGPAMKEAEANGFGSCQSAFQVVFGMISPAQKAALTTASVNRSGVTVASARRVLIPASAVKAAVTFTSRDIGDSTLEYQHGQWFITD